MNKKELEKIEDYESSLGKDLPESEIGAIASEYEKSLYIPNKKNKRQILLAPVGLVAAGKTTVLDLLYKELNLVKISGDEIRLLLRKKGYNYLMTKDIAAILTVKFLKQGYSLIFDSDCVSAPIRELIQAYKREYGFLDIWIHVNPPVKFIEEKLSKMKYEKEGIFLNKEIAIADLHRRMPLHKKYSDKIKYLYEFDTSRDDLEKQARECIDKIKREIINLYKSNKLALLFLGG